MNQILSILVVLAFSLSAFAGKPPWAGGPGKDKRPGRGGDKLEMGVLVHDNGTEYVGELEKDDGWASVSGQEITLSDGTVKKVTLCYGKEDVSVLAYFEEDEEEEKPDEPDDE